MRNELRGVAWAIVLLLVSLPGRAWGWGFWAHKEINRRAIELLPQHMKNFFLAHAEHISQHAVDPDLRRSKDSLEQFYHYLDIDHYGAYPFVELPRQYDAAVARFGPDSLRGKGIVPWRIAWFTDSLTGAMKRGDAGAIARFAAELGHYVADAHVPLHAVTDYDGVARGFKGIHKRWESDLTERFCRSLRLLDRKVFFIEDARVWAFHTILESASLADSVFEAERRALADTPGARSVKAVRASGDTSYSYSDSYYEALWRHNAGLVERRMQQSILVLASYWYTAWINAGKPVLPGNE